MKFRELIFTSLLLAGCATGPQDNAGGTDNVAVIKFGVIESIKAIELDASSSSGGSFGSVFGQIGGASAGAGRGAVTGSIFGAVLGGTLGSHADIATRPGLEIWVKLDGETGKSAYVMQPGKLDDFKIGDRVRVLRKKGESRVEAEPPSASPQNTPKP